MSLNGFETAVLQLVVDAFEDCEIETPETTLRHHGPHPVLPFCCTERGVLSIYWDDTATPSECDPPKWNLAIKWSTCWPDGINPVDYTSRDATTVRINDVAECVLAALRAAACKFGTGSPLYAHAATFGVGRTTPFGPDGKCAGVIWRIVATIRPGTPAT